MGSARSFDCLISGSVLDAAVDLITLGVVHIFGSGIAGISVDFSYTFSNLLLFSAELVYLPPGCHNSQSPISLSYDACICARTSWGP